MIITKTFDFDAAHRLDRLPTWHKCNRLHGHTYSVTLELSGPLDPSLRWIVDFATIASAWAPVGSDLDHRYLNDIPGLEVPTTEALALWILRRISATAIGPLLVGLTVSESSSTTCRVVPADLLAWGG